MQKVELWWLWWKGASERSVLPHIAPELRLERGPQSSLWQPVNTTKASFLPFYKTWPKIDRDTSIEIVDSVQSPNNCIKQQIYFRWYFSKKTNVYYRNQLFVNLRIISFFTIVLHKKIWLNWYCFEGVQGGPRPWLLPRKKIKRPQRTKRKLTMV